MLSGLGLWLALASLASAQGAELPRSLARAALDEAMPFVFDPMTLQAEDFAVVPDGTPLPSVQAKLAPDSLRWVRVSQYLVVPRALVTVTTEGGQGGTVSYAGFSHPLHPQRRGASVDVPVALIAFEDIPLVVRTVDASGVLHEASYRVQLRPRPEQRAQVAFDTSCSPYAVEVRAGALPDDAYLYVGCRLIHSAAQGAKRSTLELYMMIGQAGRDVRIEDVPTEPRSAGLWTARAGAAPGAISLQLRGRSVTLGFRIPPELHDGFIGAGLGPYLYSFEDNTTRLVAPAPLVTLYGGYSFTASTRIVFFNATALHRHGYADNGLYVWLEQARFIDDRLSFNLLLGANLLLYEADRTFKGRVSVPQGFELVTRDFFGRGYNLTAGAFLYPKLFERSYYNLWLRWGTGALFAEINYIAWEEPGGANGIRSYSLGLTFGTPVLRFL